MNTQIPVSSLLKPPPTTAGANSKHGHVVQFYEDDGFLLDTLMQSVAPALESGAAVIVVATKLHRDGLKHRLKQRGVDINRGVHEGRYITLDAAETLDRICRSGKVDRSLFFEIIGGLVKLAQRENGHTRQVVAFGEMVALLWADGKREQAIKLEQFWNELARERTFSLICAYPLNGFSRAEHEQLLHEICAEHSTVFAAEGYGVEADAERGRTIVQLQQKAQALENEMRLNEERLDLLQAAANLGTWEMDLLDDSMVLSSNAQRMLGVGNSGRIALNEMLRVMYYSGDRDTFVAALKKARTGRKEFAAEFRVKRGAQIRVMATDGKLYYNNGQPLLIGVLSDITSSRHAVA